MLGTEYQLPVTLDQFDMMPYYIYVGSRSRCITQFVLSASGSLINKDEALHIAIMRLIAACALH